jgi:hypothetical protein
MNNIRRDAGRYPNLAYARFSAVERTFRRSSDHDPEESAEHRNRRCAAKLRAGRIGVSLARIFSALFTRRYSFHYEHIVDSPVPRDRFDVRWKLDPESTGMCPVARGGEWRGRHAREKNDPGEHSPEVVSVAADEMSAQSFNRRRPRRRPVATVRNRRS